MDRIIPRFCAAWYPTFSAPTFLRRFHCSRLRCEPTLAGSERRAWAWWHAARTARPRSIPLPAACLPSPFPSCLQRAREFSSLHPSSVSPTQPPHPLSCTSHILFSALPYTWHPHTLSHACSTTSWAGGMAGRSSSTLQHLVPRSLVPLQHSITLPFHTFHLMVCMCCAFAHMLTGLQHLHTH